MMNLLRYYIAKQQNTLQDLNGVTLSYFHQSNKLIHQKFLDEINNCEHFPIVETIATMHDLT